MIMIMQVIRNENGQSMVEYGLIMGLISLAAIVALMLIGPKVKAFFDQTEQGIPGTS